MYDDWVTERFRKVHLDFHTAPFLPGVGGSFDAAGFIKTLKKSNVNVVVLFTKDHYGLSFYDTEIGKRHPGLNFDLFGKTLAEAHRHDIKVMAYHSVVWDMAAANANPDWCMLASSETSYPWDWKSVCINSPYTEELLWPQVKEIVGKYDVDGMWFDIVFFPQNTCFCEYCLRAMQAEEVNPNDPKEHQKFNERSILRFLKHTTQLVKSLKPDVKVTYNNMTRIGARDVMPYLDLFEIESVPHQWGFLYLPFYMRYIRNFDIPVLGITARFHKSWGDFGSLKGTAQLKYEIGTMLANGGMCSIGDQPDPSGELIPAVYEAVRKTYAFVAEREPWCQGAKSVPYVAVLAEKEHFKPIAEPTPSLLGAAKMLIENHIHFDVIDEETDFSLYKLIILPSTKDLSVGAIGRLREYVAGGGRLIATYQSSLTGSAQGGVDFALSDVLGVTYEGIVPYSVIYLRLLERELQQGLPAMDLVVYDTSLRVGAHPKATVLGKIVAPATERKPHRFVSHAQAPPARETQFGGIVLHQCGEGQTIYFASPIFKAYVENNNLLYRRIMQNAINILLPPSEQVLVVEAPISVEISLMQQEKRLVIHLVNCHFEKRGDSREIIEEIPVVRNIKLKVKKQFSRERVYLAPGGEPLHATEADGFITIELPELHIHAMIVVEPHEV